MAMVLPDNSGSSPHVVIVGAGPVGMATALLLARQNVRSVLLERREQPSCRQSRAVTVQRDILALYDRLGLADEIIDDGASWSLGRTYYGDQEILQLRFPPHGEEIYPPFVNFPQFRIEELLYGAALATGLVDIRLGRTVDGIEQDDSGVRVTAAGPNGPETYAGAYLVAADGIGSGVRRRLGITFDGWQTKGRFLVADFEAELPFERERRLWFNPPFHPEGIVLMHGVARKLWRLDWQIPLDADADELTETGRVEARIATVIGDHPVRVVRSNTYTFQQCRASAFRSGRAFLVGDAAHVVSPFGARGMNSGMEDAENLAWKLGYVLNGKAGPALLDSYEAERAAAADHNLAVTGASMKFMTPDDESGRQVRDAALAAALADPGQAHRVDCGKLYEPFPYHDSALTAPARLPAPRVRPGAPLPDLRCVDGSRTTTLRAAMAGELTLLAVPGRNGLISGLNAELDAIAAPAWVRRSILAPATSGPGVLTVLSDEMWDIYAGEQDVVYLVRPDCYVAAVVPLDGSPVDFGALTAQASNAAG
ncbi:pentachlorophenol monooxygenase [Spongiactinospora rosea]|uniref:Pentachlorophenol monooxygenase n=2 Tax=Spongiactinospora rosea TaxID=2248750 RepID=A0A366LR93_9ACTN|nr:pentachlorophenol monooxygenase [Spongiactinospora rosea]